MSGILYVGTNKAIGAAITGATSATVTTDTTTADGFSTSSLVSGRQSDVWTSDTSATQYIYFDLGSAKEVDFVVMHNHNLPDSVSLEYDADGNWAAGSVDLGSFTYRAISMYNDQRSSPITARYWRIKITDPGVIPQIGEVVFGTVTTMSRMFRWGMVESIVPHMAMASTQAGVPWFLQLTEDTRRFAVSWASMNRAQQDELVTLHGLLTKGPLSIVPFINSAEATSRATEVYQVYSVGPLGVTVNRDPDRHGGVVLIETPLNLVVS